MDAPTSGALRGVAGRSHDDVVAVGAQGTAIHFDGSAWVRKDTGTIQFLNDAWMSESGNAVAVGTAGTILHYDGVEWMEADFDSAETFLAVWGRGDDEIFASGTAGLLASFDGQSWHSMASGTTYGLRSISGNDAGEMVIVGNNGLVLLDEGAGLAPIRSPFETILETVSMQPRGIYFGGEQGIAWRLVRSP
jgi:hypothetical protein